jgi:serine/threonine protein kinase
VLAYECLVGKPPFHGDNYNALLWSIIHDEPVPITVFQAGDSELWRLLKTGFAKDRTGRWDSARKFGEALALWLENHGIVEDVCNRSLHASWLPAERPTQPELAPFDQLAAPPGNVPCLMRHWVPPPTLPALRTPAPGGFVDGRPGVADAARCLVPVQHGQRRKRAGVARSRPRKPAPKP